MDSSEVEDDRKTHKSDWQQLAIPIIQRSRRDLTKQQLPLSDGHFAWFPVTLRATVNRCLNFELGIVSWRGIENEMLTEWGL